MRVPLQVPSWGNEEIEDAIAVLRSGYLTMGAKVQQFERMWSEYIGVRHSIMVNSGSSANLLAVGALVATGVFKRGSWVATPATTWATTVAPLIQYGVIPQFEDIELPYYTWQPQGDSPWPAAGVHLLGSPIGPSVNLVWEDCCEAHGARWRNQHVGTYSLVSTFSLFFSHHISAAGEGGIVCTNDDRMADLLRSLRAHGWIRERMDREVWAADYPDIDPRFLFVTAGYNVRPTEVQAAFGIRQLPRLEGFVAHRGELARWWIDALKPFEEHLILPQTRYGLRESWFAFPLTIRPNSPWKRKDLTAFLESQGIETRPIMSGNITRHPMMKGVAYSVNGLLKTADLVHQNGFLIGCHQGIGQQEREWVVQSIERFAGGERCAG